jgi:TolB protein
METHTIGGARGVRGSVIAVLLAVMIAAQPAYATSPAKNGRIAFRRISRSGTKAAIFTINPDGTKERQVTHPRGKRFETEPSWSPDGRWIVFDLWRADNQDDARLFKIRSNGRHRTLIDGSCTAPCLTDSFPSWSPSGNRIAFGRGLGPSVGTNNVYAIFTMGSDGTDVRQITQTGADPNAEQPYGDDDPSWSPDGNRLAFQRTRRSNGLHAIFTVLLDGAALRRITPWKLDAASPDWSPDGQWIAFRTQENSARHGDIGLVRTTGRRLRIVTNGQGKWGVFSFTPDGRFIVGPWNIAEGHIADLYTFRLDGSHLQQVARTDASEGAPAWGPKPQVRS